MFNALSRIPVFTAVLSLLLGSVATPIIYVVIGIVAPQSGFEDLRASPLSTIALAFGVSWFFSALVTFFIGGLFWVPVHVYKYDGYIAYSCIAVASDLLIGSFADGNVALSFRTMGMVVANALAVRMVERYVSGNFKK